MKVLLELDVPDTETVSRLKDAPNGGATWAIDISWVEGVHLEPVMFAVVTAEDTPEGTVCSSEVKYRPGGSRRYAGYLLAGALADLLRPLNTTLLPLVAIEHRQASTAEPAEQTAQPSPQPPADHEQTAAAQ